MRYSVSDTAEYGDYTRGPRIVDERVKDNMRQVLKEIQDGSFAKDWIAENDEGRKRFLQLREQASDHPITKVGEELRGMMNFLKQVCVNVVKGRSCICWLVLTEELPKSSSDDCCRDPSDIYMCLSVCCPVF